MGGSAPLPSPHLPVSTHRPSKTRLELSRTGVEVAARKPVFDGLAPCCCYEKPHWAYEGPCRPAATTTRRPNHARVTWAHASPLAKALCCLGSATLRPRALACAARLETRPAIHD